MSKTVLITGCHRGIGLGLVNQYLKEGYKVVATTRNLDEAGDLKNCLKNAGEDPPIRLDVTDDVSINDAARSARERIDKLDILINNAGITTKNHPDDKALNIVRKEMLSVYDTDVIGALCVAKAFYPLMENSDVKKVRCGDAFSTIPVYSNVIDLNGLRPSKYAVINKIIRPTLFDLFVADPSAISQDIDGNVGTNPESLPRKGPTQDAHELPENPPPPLKPPPEDQTPQPPKPGGSTPYTEPPPESVTKGGPKKDPPPNTGQKSATRRPRESEIIEKGRRVPQRDGSLRSRIRGRRATIQEYHDYKNPANSPAIDTSTGPLISIDGSERIHPRHVSGLEKFATKKPPEDPNKPKGDIKGNPDKDGGYGGSPSKQDIGKGKGSDKGKGKSATAWYLNPTDQKGKMEDAKFRPPNAMEEPDSKDSKQDPKERAGYGGETQDWLPGEPTIPEAEVDEESVVGDPPKPEDMASSSPFDGSDELIDDLNNAADQSCVVQNKRNLHRHSMLGIRPSTPHLLDIFYDDLMQAVNEEALVIDIEPPKEIVVEALEVINVEATFEIVENHTMEANDNDQNTGTVKKPPPGSFYTGEEKSNIHKDQLHVPEISPEFPSENPTPKSPDEWQTPHNPEIPDSHKPSSNCQSFAPGQPLFSYLRPNSGVSRPSPRNDPTPHPLERKQGPFPKRPIPDPGQSRPGRRGPTEPSPSPGDSNPLPGSGGPIIPPDPGSFLPNEQIRH